MQRHWSARMQCLASLSWLSVEDYGTTPLEIMVVSTMKGYLRQMPEDEALRKIGEIIEPKVIRLAGEAANKRCPSERYHECALEQSFMELLYSMKRDFEQHGDTSRDELNHL